MPEINFFWEPLSDNILQERDVAGALTAEYTTEPGQYGSVVSQKQTAAPSEHQFHFDAVGSTLVVTTNNPWNYATRAYAAFGETTESTGGTITFPFQYIGQKGYYRDSVTGQYMARRRLLSRQNARWDSPDPLGVLDDVNAYRYVGNNPVNGTDPSGLQRKDQSGFYQEVDTKPTIKGYCGGAEGQVYFRFKKKEKGLNGWVIQHAIWRWDVYNCNGTPRAVTAFDFYEAWQVVDGVAYQSYMKMEAMPPWADTFTIADRGDQSKGRITITGCAMFLKAFDLRRPPWLDPDDDDYPAEAGTTPVLVPPNIPAGFKVEDSICRSLVSKWNCCTCPITPTDTSDSSGWE